MRGEERREGGRERERERERERKREKEREGENLRHLTSPLDMDAVSRVDIQPIWYKVILD